MKQRCINIYAGEDVASYVAGTCQDLNLSASTFIRLLIKAHQDGRITNACLLPQSAGVGKNIPLAQ
jgi:hypothetical protein